MEKSIIGKKISLIEFQDTLHYITYITKYNVKGQQFFLACADARKTINVQVGGSVENKYQTRRNKHLTVKSCINAV